MQMDTAVVIKSKIFERKIFAKLGSSRLGIGCLAEDNDEVSFKWEWRTIPKRFIPDRLSCLTKFSYEKPLGNQYRSFHSSCIRYTKMPKSSSDKVRINSIKNYMVAITVLTLGLSYAAVPLYGVFCQMTGYGGTTRHETDENKIKTLVRNANRKITVKFNSDVAANMSWKFRPQQTEIQVIPGETALAFYTATNPTDKPIIGVSTYNVIPFEAGPYFNKIQCFCFEEQMLNPKEKVDMPVFFYIDPEFCEDPLLEEVNEIVLSYTFFEAKEGFQVPIPNFLKNK